MRFLLTLSAAVVLGILVLAACNSSETRGNKASGNAGSRANGTGSIPTTTPGHVAPSDGVKRITTVELRDALAKGTAIVVDVRNPTDYQQSHIKGSINIPLQQVQARLSELPRDKMIVTYCSWPSEHTSAGAVQTMQKNGIENAAALLGGTDAWVRAGLPMQSGS